SDSIDASSADTHTVPAAMRVSSLGSEDTPSGNSDTTIRKNMMGLSRSLRRFRAISRSRRRVARKALKVLTWAVIGASLFIGQRPDSGDAGRRGCRAGDG